MPKEKPTDAQKKEWAEARKAQLDAVTKRLEEGVAEVFSSEKYAEYLRTMAKFSSYSTNNTLLIAMQRPDATLVAGYEAWQSKFGRHVKRGEKGIKIYAPVPYKTTIEREKVDPKTKLPLLDNNGKPLTEEVEIRRASYKITTVFDVSQTEGKPLPELSPTILQEDVANYDLVLQALIQTAKIPVSFIEINSGANGYFDRANKCIAIKNDLPETQTIKTLIHEIAHSRLHDADIHDKESMAQLPDQRTREVQAESVAFVVASHYGLDTGDYSFTYIAGWSEGRETSELKASLTTIRETANDIIQEFDENLKQLEQAQHIDPEIGEELDDAEQGNDGIERPYRYYITEESLQNGTYPSRENVLVTETPQKQFYENQTVEAYGFIDSPEPFTMKELEQHSLVPSDENPPPPVTEAAYEIGNGDFLEVHFSDDGWLYTLYDKNLAEVDGGCFTGPQTIEEARDEALAVFHLENAQNKAIDRADFQKRLDFVEEHHLSAQALPYVMAEGDSFKLDIDTEPVVTFVESTHPAIREGMQLPLHLAEKLTKDLDIQQSKSNRGKGANAVTYSVVARIDYKVKDEQHHHHETLPIGNKSGGLMLSMERHANERISRFEQHPDEGNPEPWKVFVETHIPALYQQSMKSENQVLDQTLPQPQPFYNMTMSEGKNDPNIGFNAIVTSHQVTQKCKAAMDAGLENACHHKAVYQFLQRMTRQFGKERVQAVLSATVQNKSYDGRFHSDVKEYAAKMPLNIGQDARGRNYSQEYTLNAHSVIVDYAVRAFRKMTEPQRDADRKPSIRGRLRNSQQASKNAPQRTQQQSRRRGKQNEL